MKPEQIDNRNLKEALFTVILNYLGIVLGYINMIILIPYFFQPETIGAIQISSRIGYFLAFILAFGLPSSIIKYYPLLGLKKFLASTKYIFIFIGFGIGALIWIYFFFPTILPLGDLPSEYYWLPYGLGLIFLGNFIFANALIALKKVVLATFFTGNFFRFFVFASAIYCFFYPPISDGTLLFIFFLGNGFALIGLTYFFIKRNKNLKPLPSYTPGKPNEIYSFSFFSLLSAIGGRLLTQVDTFMVAEMEINGMYSVGIYSIGVFIATVIEIPRYSISGISLVIFSKAWQDKNFQKMKGLLEDTALGLCLLTFPLFFVIAFNLEEFYSIMPKGNVYRSGLWVAIFISLSKVIDLSFGSNTELISSSEKYKVNLYFMLILVGVNILINFYLIPMYGITGAAIATLISTILFNIMKEVYIRHQFNIGGITIHHFTTLIYWTASAGLLYLINENSGYLFNENIFLSVGTKTLVITILFWANLRFVNKKFVLKLLNSVTFFIKRPWIRKLIFQF